MSPIPSGLVIPPAVSTPAFESVGIDRICPVKRDLSLQIWQVAELSSTIIFVSESKEIDFALELEENTFLKFPKKHEGPSIDFIRLEFIQIFILNLECMKMYCNPFVMMRMFVIIIINKTKNAVMVLSGGLSSFPKK